MSKEPPTIISLSHTTPSSHSSSFLFNLLHHYCRPVASTSSNMYYSITSTILLLAALTQFVSGHGAIIKAVGDAGGNGMALGGMNTYPLKF